MKYNKLLSIPILVMPVMMPLRRAATKKGNDHRSVEVAAGLLNSQICISSFVFVDEPLLVRIDIKFHPKHKPHAVYIDSACFQASLEEKLHWFPRCVFVLFSVCCQILREGIAAALITGPAYTCLYPPASG